MSRPELQTSEDYSFHRLVEGRGLSGMRSYQALVVGDPRISQLIKYELLLGTIAFLPGALGILVRRYLYRSLFRELGSSVVIGRSVSVRHPGKISIGARSVIDDYAVLNAQGPATSEIVIGEAVLIGRDTLVKTRGGTIFIHSNADIGQSCRIGTTQRIEIGSHTLIGGRCYIGGANHRIEDPESPIALQGLERKGGVIIEDDVWLGAHVIVLDGVRVGKGSVVGAGSVVTSDIPGNSIAHGVPARVIRSRT